MKIYLVSKCRYGDFDIYQSTPMRAFRNKSEAERFTEDHNKNAPEMYGEKEYFFEYCEVELIQGLTGFDGANGRISSEN